MSLNIHSTQAAVSPRLSKSVVSVTGRLHDLRYVLVDLAASKSKSSSIASLSVEAERPKRQGGGGGRRSGGDGLLL